MYNQNIIITEPSKNLRALGRNALQGKWKLATITVILYFVVAELPQVVLDALFGSNPMQAVTNSGYTYGVDPGLYANFYNSMPETCTFSGIYSLLVSGALTLGLCLFFLATFRKHETAPQDLFLGFERFGKSLGLFLFQALFIFLWALLLVFPGVIAAIRYSQAFYILADDPTKGIRQCMDESKEMMKGNKLKYFCLCLSFIGWALLSSIPAGILSSIGSVVSDNTFVAAIFAFVGVLFMSPVYAYIYSTLAGFYEILSGHLIKDTQPVPVTQEEAQALFANTEAASEEKTEPKEDAEPKEEAKADVEETEKVEAASEEKTESEQESNSEADAKKDVE